MAAGAPTGQRARIAALVEPVVAGAGYDLEDLTVSQAGRRNVVRVVVDADGGISLDDIAEVSRAVAGVLDEVDADGGFVGRSPYTLEVTSPGVDRPLTLPRHWARNVGRLVKVAIDQQTVTGRITAATGNAVRLDVNGTAREVPYSQLGNGKVQVEFSRSEAGRPESGTARAGKANDATEGDDA